jgi:hypothetical protein
VGKHAAPGSSSHPLVAAALAQRPGGSGAHREDRLPGEHGPIGWPGSDRSPGGGIGWPGEFDQGDADQGDEEPAPPARRSAAA